MNPHKQAFKSCCERHNAAIKYTYYREDYRKDLVKRMNDEEDTIIAFFKDNYDDICEACKETLKRIDKEKTIIEELEKYKNVFMPALDMGIRMYQQQNKATHVDAMEYEIPNVFDSITKDNYKAFLRSFEDGVDLTICNINGYSPLTLAVALGNNPMVKFMLDHDADPSIKDRRGYNAFHTAVENQFRDLCKMLLDYDPDLINARTDKGESVKMLAQKQTFTKWIENEINNIY